MTEFFGSRTDVTVILLGSEFECRKGQEIFMFPQNIHTGSEAQSACYAMGTVLVPGVQQLVHEVDHSYPPTAKVMNGWSYISTSPICLHGVDRENLTFLPFMAWFLHYEQKIRSVQHVVL
jgi:hypothetical protein